MHVGSRNHNQKTGRRELFVFVAHPGARLASTLPPGTALAWKSSLPLGPLLAKAALGTFQPASPHSSRPSVVPAPLSAPFQPLKGSSLEEALEFSMSLSPASKLHCLLPPPGLDHPAQENTEPLPAPLREPPSPPETGGVVLPPTLNIYWQSITGKHSTLETDASPAAARGIQACLSSAFGTVI